MSTDKRFFHAITIALVRYARYCGMVDREIDEILGLDPSRLDLSAIYVDSQQLYCLIQTISDRFSVRISGIKLAELGTVADHGITAYLLMNCQNMKQVLENMQKYFPLMGNVTHLTVRFDDSLASLNWKAVQTLPGDLERIVMEYLVVGFTENFHELTCRRVPVSRVAFSFPEPENISEYTRAFGRKPEFNSDRTTLVFSRSYLELPLQTANSELLTVFEEHARQRYGTLIGTVSVAEKVGSMLLAELPQSPGLSDIAGNLGISPRTLQQNLRDEGTTFINLRNQARYRYARQALERRELSIPEIGFRLGFAEPSSFYHAFKRWSGKTPRQYQKEFRTETGRKLN